MRSSRRNRRDLRSFAILAAVLGAACVADAPESGDMMEEAPESGDEMMMEEAPESGDEMMQEAAESGDEMMEESGSPVEQGARDFVQSLTDAYLANDVAAYMAHYAMDLTWWGPGGRGSWDAYNDSWTEFVAATGGVAGTEISDVQVHALPSGEAAVVSYLLTADYREEDGSIRTANYQMSTTLMMRDDEWKVVHLHFSAANPQGD